MSDTPRRSFFALRPGTDFVGAFADGFHARFGTLPPADRARITVMANTGRALRLLEEAIADRAPTPGPLPRMVLMSELYADPLLAPDLPPAISPMRRLLRLTVLVQQFLAAKAAAGEPVAPQAAAPELARALALLIDQFHDEQIPPEHLDALTADVAANTDSARHWEQTLAFVDIVRQLWPRIRHEEEDGALDPRERQTAVVDALIARWQAAPPPDPVIAAGSTGSVRSTAKLLLAVAALPAGAVVLPGFDPDVDPAIWRAAGPDHPMGPFHRWMASAGISPGDVAGWLPEAPSARATVIAQALRPAPVTDAWHEAGPALKDTIGAATGGLSLIEAESPRAEAEAIAIAMREVIETPGRTVSLVTPDAALARRVSAALTRFAVEPDDTGGTPLSLSPPGVLLTLLARLCAGIGDAVDLAALLQHPLVVNGMARLDHLALARRYELRVLRGEPLAGIAVPLPPWPTPHRPDPDTDAPRAAWLSGLNGTLAEFAATLSGGATLHQALSAHLRTAEALTRDPEAEIALWRDEAGRQMRSFMDRLLAASPAYGDTPVADYPTLLVSLIQGENLRPAPRTPHPRVAIRGPREARLEAADVTILAGLNDGTWPQMPDPGPWISRPMHAALGLPLPERTVGLAAHDFQQAISRPRVILSRARKIDGAPTVGSRWLIRLETLIKGIGAGSHWDAMQARGARFLALAERLGTPEAQVPRAERPAPRIAPAQMPRRLSVTRIERLVRDPYAIYARYVLGLEPIEPLGRTPDARERGTVLHTIVERLQTETPDWPGESAATDRLLAIADQVLDESVPWPDLRRAWRARITRFAPDFIRREAERRAGATPIAAESRGCMVFDLPGGPFTLRAMADRIDRRPDGTAAIYDYKTGAMPSKGTIEAGFHQQMHLQAAILSAGGFDTLGPMQAVDGAYLNLSGSRDFKDFPVANLADSAPTHLERVQALLTAHESGAPFIARLRVQSVRESGDYDHLARFGEWGIDEDDAGEES